MQPSSQPVRPRRKPPETACRAAVPAPETLGDIAKKFIAIPGDYRKNIFPFRAFSLWLGPTTIRRAWHPHEQNDDCRTAAAQKKWERYGKDLSWDRLPDRNSIAAGPFGWQTGGNPTNPFQLTAAQ
jgi:hypothetical protein